MAALCEDVCENSPTCHLYVAVLHGDVTVALVAMFGWRSGYTKKQEQELEERRLLIQWNHYQGIPMCRRYGFIIGSHRPMCSINCTAIMSHLIIHM